MKSYEDIVVEYSKERGLDDWEQFDNPSEYMEIAKRYAIEVSKQTLINVAKKSQEMRYYIHEVKDILDQPMRLSRCCYAVPKQTILNDNNIPIL